MNFPTASVPIAMHRPVQARDWFASGAVGFPLVKGKPDEHLTHPLARC